MKLKPASNRGETADKTEKLADKNRILRILKELHEDSNHDNEYILMQFNDVPRKDEVTLLQFNDHEPDKVTLLQFSDVSEPEEVTLLQFSDEGDSKEDRDDSETDE